MFTNLVAADENYTHLKDNGQRKDKAHDKIHNPTIAAKPEPRKENCGAAHKSYTYQAFSIVPTGWIYNVLNLSSFLTGKVYYISVKSLKMDFRPLQLKPSLLMVAMSFMVLSAAGQPSGQSIIFSTPQTEDSQSTTPSLRPQNSQSQVLPGMLQAPISVFGSGPQNDLPPPSPQLNAYQQQQMKKLLDERKNWALMTPEEILGAPSGQTFQSSDLNASGNGKNQTQLERFLARESQTRNGPTNGWQNAQTDSSWNLSRDQNNFDPLNSKRENKVDSAFNFNELQGGQQDHDVFANQNGNRGWDSFSQPLPQTTSTKRDLEQLAAMERFQQLIAPSAVPAADSTSESKFFTSSKPVLNPNINQPDFLPNPAGASFIPLTTGISKPSGLTPLPGVETPVSQTFAAPTWTPQQPPWLRQGPQPFVMPQRKF